MLPHQAIELLKLRPALDEVVAFPSPRGRRHLAQKALGIAQIRVQTAYQRGSRRKAQLIYRGPCMTFGARLPPGSRGSVALVSCRIVFSITSPLGRRHLRSASLRRRGTGVAAEAAGLIWRR